MIIERADLYQALPFLEMAEQFDTTGGTCTAADLCAQADSFMGLIEGRPVMAYALAHRGPVAWVMAAGGLPVPGLDMTRAIVERATAQAREAGARQIAITTARPGMVRKLQRLGLSVTGTTLRKAIT